MVPSQPKDASFSCPHGYRGRAGLPLLVPFGPCSPPNITWIITQSVRQIDCQWNTMKKMPMPSINFSLPFGILTHLKAWPYFAAYLGGFLRLSFQPRLSAAHAPSSPYAPPLCLVYFRMASPARLFRRALPPPISILLLPSPHQ